MSPTKRCWKCGVEKPVEEFANDPSKKDGKHGRCKRCDSEWRKEHRHERRSYKRSYKRTINGFTDRCWNRLNQRTVNGTHPRPENRHIRVYLDQGIQLQITKEELRAIVAANWPTIETIWKAGGKPSIDRIDSTGHYAADNIQFIPLSDNCRKSGLKSGRARAASVKKTASARMARKIRQSLHLEDRYLSRHELAKFLGICTRTVDRRALDGSLPPPVLIGPPGGKKARRWLQSAVVAKLEKRHG